MLLLDCHQLVDRIKDRILDTGARIQLLLRNDLVYFLIHALCTAVTIAYGIAEQLVILIEQCKIHAPCVDRHTCGDLADLLTLFDACEDLLKCTLMIPAQMSVLLHHAVLKTVDLLQYDFSVLNTS